MEKYLVKTNKDEKKTQIVRLGENPERIGLVYTDFLIRPGIRDINSEEIVDPLTNKAIGQIRIFRKKDIIVVRTNGKEIAALGRDGSYREDGLDIPFRRYDKKDLSSERYSQLRSLGLNHAYSLGEKSQLSHLFCFERNGDLASLVYSKEGAEGGLNLALKSLALALAQRIENQDYVFEFLK